MHRSIIKLHKVRLLQSMTQFFLKGTLTKVRTRRMYEQGMTLIELLISLSILAILISLAAPSFVAMINNNRVTAATNDLVSSFNLARTEAIKRNGTVLIIKKNTAGSRNCGNYDWACGHQIQVSSTSEVLRDVKAPHALVDMDSDNAELNQISYIASGEVLAATEFTFDTSSCEDGDVRKVRKITLGLSGGSSLTTTNTTSCP